MLNNFLFRKGLINKHQIHINLSPKRIERLYSSHALSFFKSIYEGYGVLLEEIEEVWDAIKSNESSKRISEELIQVGAMCLKMCLSPIW